MEKLIEKLKDLQWIQLGDDGVSWIPRMEKDCQVDAGHDLSLYWVNLGRLIELLGKEK